jgi:Skp family chaperone for outer membrane proteins
MKTRFIPVALVAMLAAAPAFALEPLNTEKHINEALVAGRVADVIRNTCPSISAKMLTVLQELNALEAYLRDKGYTEAEVKAFRKNKDEKARIKGLANDYLTAAGAVEGDVESYCKAGRDEIAKGTLAGSLLRSWK